jgi:hypothetical protein
MDVVKVTVQKNSIFLTPNWLRKEPIGRVCNFKDKPRKVKTKKDTKEDYWRTYTYMIIYLSLLALSW